jgi:hypothetical protein
MKQWCLLRDAILSNGEYTMHSIGEYRWGDSCPNIELTNSQLIFKFHTNHSLSSQFVLDIKDNFDEILSMINRVIKIMENRLIQFELLWKQDKNQWARQLVIVDDPKWSTLPFVNILDAESNEIEILLIREFHQQVWFYVHYTRVWLMLLYLRDTDQIVKRLWFDKNGGFERGSIDPDDEWKFGLKRKIYLMFYRFRVMSDGMEPKSDGKQYAICLTQLEVDKLIELLQKIVQ